MVIAVVSKEDGDKVFEKVGKYTNADDIVASTGMDNMETAILADKMRYESIKKKDDFTFETVLSSDYKMEILRKAKKEGIKNSRRRERMYN